MRLLAILITLFAISLAGGCHYFSDRFGEEKMIPAATPDTFPHLVKARVYRVWVGNELQIKFGSNVTAYILLEGVNNPDTGDKREQQAIDYLNELIDGKDVEVEVRGVDRLKRWIGQVSVNELNLNYEMIRVGWGQYDGSDFPGKQDFLAATEKAKENLVGMWEPDK